MNASVFSYFSPSVYAFANIELLITAYIKMTLESIRHPP